MDQNISSSFWIAVRHFEYIKKVLPGVHFHPTDNELLVYLPWKKNGDSRANIIKQVPLDNCNPDELQREFSNGNGDEAMYIFTEAKPIGGKRVVRRVGNGTWRSGTGAKDITHGGKTIGYKTTLTFYYIEEGKKRKKTIWNMHEYRLPQESAKRNVSDNLVLCKIYKRRAAGENCAALDEENKNMSSMASNEIDVSNSSEQMHYDVGPTECVEINYQLPKLPIEDADDLRWIEECLMDEEIGNDPKKFSEEELNHFEKEFGIFLK